MVQSEGRVFGKRSVIICVNLSEYLGVAPRDLGVSLALSIILINCHVLGLVLRYFWHIGSSNFEYNCSRVEGRVIDKRSVSILYICRSSGCSSLRPQ